MSMEIQKNLTNEDVCLINYAVHITAVLFYFFHTILPESQMCMIDKSTML